MKYLFFKLDHMVNDLLNDIFIVLRFKFFSFESLIHDLSRKPRSLFSDTFYTLIKQL